MPPRDPYRYFRVEARELLDALGRGVVAFEKDTAPVGLIGEMLRHAHTLKGAARVVGRRDVAEAAHALEDVLAKLRAGGPPGRDDIATLLENIDRVAACLTALESPEVPVAQGLPAEAPEAQTIRVEIREMDSLLDQVIETEIRLASVRGQLEDVARARNLAASLLAPSPLPARTLRVAEEIVGLLTGAVRSLGAGMDDAGRDIEQVREKTSELRLVPASAIFGHLERTAHDAARALGKQVRVETSGGEQRLDANVLYALRDALVQVVRNAVAHGIEPEPQRELAGKSGVGRVRVDVLRRGRRVAFVCSDDGSGIDVAAVRRVALARGIVTPTQVAALDEQGLMRLVLESGMTTSASVTEVAGRGVGLDVVRETVARLNGEVTLASDPGHGTTVDVCVPVSLSSIAALVVAAGEHTCALPLDCVWQTLRLSSSDIARSADGDSVLIEGTVVPFMLLAKALGESAAPGSSNRAWSTVVIRAGLLAAAIGVDRLVETSTVVLRPLPRLTSATTLVAGASLDAAGNPQSLLDPRALVELARTARSTDVAVRRRTRAPILVVDDSLTTRMLEKSILESAGFAVDLATSAEDALEKVRHAAYCLFLVDVEMPGMDGFEFVARTRADATLQGIPAILVTSRNSPEDRRRGEQAGARGYIVKGEFDQANLLRTIHHLVGAP